MLQEQIYSQAIETIKARRRAAQEQQDARTDQIRREIPETAELDRQLRSACMEIARTMGSAQCAQQLRAIEQHTREAFYRRQTLYLSRTRDRQDQYGADESALTACTQQLRYLFDAVL